MGKFYTKWIGTLTLNLHGHFSKLVQKYWRMLNKSALETNLKASSWQLSDFKHPHVFGGVGHANIAKPNISKMCLGQLIAPDSRMHTFRIATVTLADRFPLN